MRLLRQINDACENNDTALVAQLVQRYPEKKWWRFARRDDKHIGGKRLNLTKNIGLKYGS